MHTPNLTPPRQQDLHCTRLEIGILFHSGLLLASDLRLEHGQVLALLLFDGGFNPRGKDACRLVEPWCTSWQRKLRRGPKLKMSSAKATVAGPAPLHSVLKNCHAGRLIPAYASVEWAHVVTPKQTARMQERVRPASTSDGCDPTFKSHRAYTTSIKLQVSTKSGWATKLIFTSHQVETVSRAIPCMQEIFVDLSAHFRLCGVSSTAGKRTATTLHRASIKTIHRTSVTCHGRVIGIISLL